MRSIVLTMPTNARAKDVLRKAIRARLKGNIFPKPSINRAFEPGKIVAIFAATPGEPDLLPLISRHPEVHWALPKVIAPGIMDFYRVQDISQLKLGAFGILEPSPDSQLAAPASIDEIFCPGLAFTKDGQRLGQGGGYYDRYLPQCPNARRIGVCFECQIVENLPNDDHDIAMHELLTAPSEPPA